MSVPQTRIYCTECDLERWYVDRPIRIVYRWPIGKEWETRRSQGWCYECDNYRDIENMDRERLASDLVEMEWKRHVKRARLAELSNRFLAGIRYRSARRTLRYAIERLDKEIQDIEKLLDIATQRNSRSRCLTCWSDKTARATFDFKGKLTRDFKHACGGMLVSELDLGGLWVRYATTRYVLNTEGELLERLVGDPPWIRRYSAD